MKKDVLEYQMQNADGIGVYCGTYKKYNEGSLYGMWIDFALCDDADEFFEVCRKLHDDEEYPELMFQDFQGFPRSLYSECLDAETVEKIIEYTNMSDEDKEMLEDFAECYGGGVSDLDIDEVRDRCVGSGYTDFKDWCDEQADEMIDGYESSCEYDYSCKGAGYMIEKMRRYFDYDAYAREQEMYYSMGSNGYIFDDCN